MNPSQSSDDAGTSNVGAREIPTRAAYPRQLIIYDDTTGDWQPINDSDPARKKIIISMDYLAVSYRQNDFPDKDKLTELVHSICEARQMNAYWLDFACIGMTQTEKNEDLYRIADVKYRARSHPKYPGPISN